jgi:4'-phosphopantetheinyl transferase
VATPDLATYSATLSPPELERGARFHFQLHRDRFIAGRGLLRTILSGYLGIDPRAVGFSYGPNGKPALAGRADATALHFNLAHSEDLALLAVTRAGNVGIDVERIRPLENVEELVARFFSPCESGAFQNLPASEKPVAFFNLWTRKEAWLKATGEGIGHSLNLVEVSFLPGAPARLVRLPANLAQPPCWSLHDLAPAPDFAAAVALAVTNARLHCWRWDPEIKSAV